MKKTIFFAIQFVAFAATTFAQKSDVGNWFIYFGNQPINKKWNLQNEVQYRNYNVVGDM